MEEDIRRPCEAKKSYGSPGHRYAVRGERFCWNHLPRERVRELQAPALAALPPEADGAIYRWLRELLAEELKNPAYAAAFEAKFGRLAASNSAGCTTT